MTDTTRRTSYAKLPWEDIVDRAKSANGRWILGAQAVPTSVLRTVRQGRNNKVIRADGHLIARAGEKASTPEGELVDMYVRWEWTPGFEPPGKEGTGYTKRKLTVPTPTAIELTAAAASRDESRSEILRRAVSELAGNGTTYKPPVTTDLVFDVNDYVWERAQQRVAEVGVPFHAALVHEVNRQLRLLKRRKEGPSPK